MDMWAQRGRGEWVKLGDYEGRIRSAAAAAKSLQSCPKELTSTVRLLRIFNKYFHHPPPSRKIKQTNCALKFKLAKLPEAPNLPQILHLVLVILKSFPFQATLIIPL